MPETPDPPFDLDDYLERHRARVDSALASVLPGPLPGEDPLRLREAMRASVLEGGKRIRPILVVAACEAVGGSGEDVLEAACALELVHAYSLVHDDLPAMDNDLYRRGRPTCHHAFGETCAILVGDALLTLAFERLAGAAPRSPAAADRAVRATRELARAAGQEGMVGGQAMDMVLKSEEPSFEELERCHTRKTAALFSAATAIGAILGGGQERSVELLRGYGADLGLAFQHADDLSDAEFTRHRERALARALELSARAAHSASKLGPPATPLIAIARWMESRTREASTHEVP
jgi:geranylgeranyl pyrophosphate synthase